MSSLLRLSDPPLLIKAAQSVWAVNKYFILACSQKDYQEIRTCLRPDLNDYSGAFAIMKKADENYKDMKSEELPQLTNALYHMAGYFKKHIPSERRQEINECIRTAPAQALLELEELTHKYQVDYLLHTRLWADTREKPFNLIPVRLNIKGRVYEPYTLQWQNDHIRL